MKTPSFQRGVFCLLLVAACVVRAGAATVTPSSGPFAGGNPVLVTNAVPDLGDGSDITNAVLGGVSTTNITGQGANWVRFVAPAVGSTGAMDIVIRSASEGETTLAGAYTVNPTGQVGWIEYVPTVWTNLGSGANNIVRALAHDGTQLYAGGEFITAGGVTVYRVAKWDLATGTWTNLGSGMNNIVYALAHDGSRLYAGGSFTTADGATANRIAMWDPATGTWTNLGSGMSSTVYALAHDGTSLYAGGAFTTAGGVTVNQVAKWDPAGLTWTNLGSGMNDIVYALACDGTNLYAGGAFTTAGGSSANRIARWNPASGTWGSLLSGTLNTVLALAYDGASLYVGGSFSSAGGINVNRVAKWNPASTTWSGLDKGVSNTVRALAYDGMYLYAGGEFTNASGMVAHRVAKWNPANGTWTNLGSGVNGIVRALAHDGTSLYAGGEFTTADGISASRIARCEPAYTVEFPGVEPDSGSATGGYTVVISGFHLGNGTDITNVTLCGGSAASIQSQSATQVVIVAGIGNADLRDVRVFSTSFGETVRSNAFTCFKEEQAITDFLPTNGSLFIANGTVGLSAAVSSGLEVSFAVTEGPGSVAGTNLSFTGAGSVTVVASQPGSGAYHPAPDATNTYRVYGLSAYTGPYTGGGTLTITNGAIGTITNVLLGGVQAAIVGSDSSWVSITVPSLDSAGAKDIVIQTSDHGDITLPGVYTVNPAGRIGLMEYGPNVWTNLGAGMDGEVRALAHDGTNLYAGGIFTTAGGAPANRVARWNPANGSWTNLGDGVNGHVQALVYDGTNLYAGGDFSFAGESEAHCVAKWDPANATWTNLGMGIPEGGVLALAHDGTGLYAGGVFSYAGEVSAESVARWDPDGETWSNLNAGIPGGVYALACDGSGLYAGGYFDLAGGKSAKNAARWDPAGETWTNLGSGMNNEVWALAHDGTGLYAGGLFTNAGGVAARYIAKWNPESRTWTNLGAGMNTNVYVLAHDGTHLYAGGLFTNAGGVAANRIAKWDPAGEAWTTLGSGMNREVLALTHDGIYLYAGGLFTNAGGVAAKYIAKWGPSHAIEISAAPSHGSATGGYPVVIYGCNLGNGTDITNVTLCGVSAAAIQSQSATQVVVIAGAGSPGQGDIRVFSTSFGETVKSNAFSYYMISPLSGPYPGGNTITITNGHFGAITNVRVGFEQAAILDSGANWVTITAPAVATPGAKDVVIQTSDHGDILLEQAYTVNPAGRIFQATYGEDNWTNLGNGLSACVEALACDETGLYAGGQFLGSWGEEAKYVARWEPVSETWTNLGSGANNYVHALAWDGACLYAGGAFTMAGGVSASYVAKWNPDSRSWTNLGSGLNDEVRALAYDGTNLYAGGDFTAAGGAAANYVAKWDPETGTWTNLGSGISGSVYALAHDGTFLYAGGYFTNSGGVAANSIARWDPSSRTWTNLGSGVDLVVQALAHDGTDLYAGGLFTTAGGTPANYVAKWSPANACWTNLGSGANNYVYALTHDGTNLYAGGVFTNAGGVAASRVAKWDPASGTWTNLHSGVTQEILALAHDGTYLYAGGWFTHAGGIAARSAAKWGPSYSEASGVVPSSGSVTGDYLVVISGSNLGSGSDITNVTLCGASAAGIQGQSATQVVIVAAAGLGGLGDVRVFSTSFGETARSNAFEYLRQQQAPLVFEPATPQTYLTTNALSVSGGSGTGMVSYAVLSGPGAFSDNTNLAVTAGSGTIEVRATKAQDDLYLEASVTGTVEAAKADQAIAGFLPTNGSVFVMTDEIGLSATASSGLEVFFVVGGGPGNIADGTNLSFTAPGEVRVVASQAGNANWNAAPEVTNSYTIAKAEAEVTLHDLAQTYDGTPRVVTASTTPIGLTVNITYDGSETAPTDAGSYSITGVVDDVMYVGMQTGTLVVSKGAAGVYLLNLTHTYDGTAKSASATTMPAGLMVEFTYDGNASAPTNGGTYAVTGTVNDANYAGSASDIFTISKADQTIADFLPTNGSVFVMTETTGLSATASSGLLVSFATNQGPGLITEGTNLSFTGHGEVAVVAAQAGDINWNPAPEVTNLYTVLGLFEVTVESEYGTTIPATGIYTMLVGSVFTNQAQTPDTRGTTQYACQGWVTRGGLDPAAGAGTQAVVTVNGVAVLTWLWKTNYWLDTEAGPNGTVNVGDGWQDAGVTTQVTADADLYYHFTNWTGDAAGGSNPLDLLMDGPKSILANFAETLAAQGTPHWWLAWHELTNNGASFDEAEAGDTDFDTFTAGEEYIADTDPTDSNSYFRVTQITHESPVTVRFDSSTGRLYILEGATNLVNGLWTNVPGAGPRLGAGDGDALTDTNEPPWGPYYRLGVELP